MYLSSASKGKYPIILRMREQSVAGLLSPPKEACEGGYYDRSQLGH